jgi:hypothetical protein
MAIMATAAYIAANAPNNDVGESIELGQETARESF